ncbi:MAG TPA: FG-GAP repeat protein [Phycisphaerae bacterium]|nr:FG-GAP repeat protein [Phycisphaerae bacterium]
MLFGVTRQTLVLTVAVLILAGPAHLARAQCQSGEIAKLVASDAATGDQLGFASAISGDTAVIGARYGDGNEADSGAAYVYVWDGSAWIEEAKLIADDGGYDDAFGRTVAVWDGTVSGRRRAVIGATRADPAGDASGAAYVFLFDGQDWVQEQRLLGTDTTAGDNFGYSVAIWGETVVVGARGDGGWIGSAYVFEFDGLTWVQQQKLVASDGADGDQFGTSVAIADEVIVVGAYSDDNANGVNAGAAYAYRYNGSSWDQEDKLIASNGAPDDSFGWAVAAWGDVVVVGAYQDDDNGAASGSAYAFRYAPGPPADWLEEQHLLSSDGAFGDRFGYAVAAAPDVAVISAHLDDDQGASSGSAYVFHFNGASWTEAAKLLPADGAGGDQFGQSLAVSGLSAAAARRIVAGAFRDADAGAASGSAYVFANAADCNGNGVLDLCDIALATSHDYNADGLPDECEGVVPALSPLGLITMSLLLLAAGGVLIRRRLRITR